MMTASGTIFYQDEYSTLYRVVWETIDVIIDMTTTIFQPFVWGQPPQAYINNGILFRRGIFTIHRQVIRPLIDGYELVAEGFSQFIDFEQMTYLCGGGPIDHFRHHLDCAVSDECDTLVTLGSHWSDPDNSDVIEIVWGDINLDGSPIATVGALEWIDVWA